MNQTTDPKPSAEITDIEELRREIRAAMLNDDQDRRDALEARHKQWYEEQAEEIEAARDKVDAEYLSWCERQSKTSEKMRQSDLFPSYGGLEQPIFWQDGKAVESGAARLDYYDSRHELRILLNTVRTYQKSGNYQLPKAFLLEAAQLFYGEGQLCEVRLSGYDMTPRGKESGSPFFARWQTQVAPKVEANEEGVKLTVDDAERPQVAILNETANEILTLERDFYTRTKSGAHTGA